MVCGYVEISTTSSGFGRRLPFTMLFASVCELTMRLPGPVCSMGHKRIPGRRSQGREQSERLSRRPAFPPRGVSLLERRGLVIGSIGVAVGVVVPSVSNAGSGRYGFSTPLGAGATRRGGLGADGGARGG